MHEANADKQIYKLDVEQSNTPSDIIVKVIHAKLSKTNNNHEQINEIVKCYKDSYLLCVCGCDEILYGYKNPIGSYKVCLLNRNALHVFLYKFIY